MIVEDLTLIKILETDEYGELYLSSKKETIHIMLQMYIKNLFYQKMIYIIYFWIIKYQYY